MLWIDFLLMKTQCAEGGKVLLVWAKEQLDLDVR